MYLEHAEVVACGRILWDTISYPLFADADTEIIHTQHRNTTRGRKPSVVLRCYELITSHRPICISKQGATDLSHVCHILKRFHGFKIAALLFV